MKSNFSVTGVIGEAVTLSKRSWYILALFFVVFYIVEQFAGGLFGPSAFDILTALNSGTSEADRMEALTALMFNNSGSFVATILVSALIQSIFYTGFYKACLDVVDGNQPDFDVFKQSIETYVQFVLCSLCCSIIGAIGLFLCLLPGFYVIPKTFLAPFYVLDRRMTAIQAIQAAWNDSNDNFWPLLGAWLLVALFAACGYLLCCVGVIYTIPVSYVAYAIVYRHLTGENVSETPVEQEYVKEI